MSPQLVLYWNKFRDKVEFIQRQDAIYQGLLLQKSDIVCASKCFYSLIIQSTTLHQTCHDIKKPHTHTHHNQNRVKSAKSCVDGLVHERFSWYLTWHLYHPCRFAGPARIDVDVSLAWFLWLAPVRIAFPALACRLSMSWTMSLRQASSLLIEVLLCDDERIGPMYR